MPDATSATIDRNTRSFEMTLDINASPDDVWRALTEEGELVRWFPLQARVTPGMGGTMFWGWGDHWQGEARIDAWDPGRRLRLVDERPAFDAEGNLLPVEPARMAMEFTLETHDGRTRLRLVHSGFAQGQSWDDELDSTSAGWQFELRSLRLYLERHRGHDRHYGLAYTTSPHPPSEVWRRLLSPALFTLTNGRVAEGEICVMRVATGEQFTGRVRWHKPAWDLFLTIDELDEGVLRISTWRGGGRTGVQVWLTTYDPARASRVREFGERMRPLLTRLMA
jgi:uncharacterized protein YndB with AHSA1/START domain